MDERPLPSLNALRSFDAAARHLNQTRAAEELCVTPSAISKQIAVLEDHFGFALFERGQFGLRLTPRGAKCARATAQAFKQLSRDLQQVMREGDAPLRVMCDTDFAHLWLLPLLDRFRELHPDLPLELEIANEPGPVMPRHDCTLSWGQHMGGGSPVIEPIFLNTTFIVAAPGARATRLLRDAPDKLENGDLINDRRPRWWDRYCAELRLTHLNPHQSPTYPTTAMCMEAAALGHGLVIADEVTSRAYLDSGRLEIVMAKKIQTADTYYASWRDDPGKDPRLDRFRDWILQEADEHRHWFDEIWQSVENR